MTSVSVIVPAYNAARTLRETLDSIRLQSLAVGEVIVVDDGSTDETAAAAASVEGSHVIRQANSGTAAALNAGLAVARGEVFGFLDADDLWRPHAARTHLENLRASPGADASVGWVEEFVCPSLDRDTARDFLPRAPQEAWLSGATFVWAESFRRVGPFAPETLGWPWIEWVHRAKLHGLNFRTVDQVVLRRRLHPGSLSMSVEAGRGKGLLRAARLAMKRRSAATVDSPE